MLKPIVIIGGGGHSKVLIEVIRLLKVPLLGIVDNLLALNNVCDIPVLGDDSVIDTYPSDEINLVNGVGSTEPYSTRTEIFYRFKKKGYRFASLIHPSAVLPKQFEFGEGVQIMAGVVIQPCVRIGANTIINTNVSIDHDVSIGSHVHIAPGVTVSGSVNIGKHVHVGTGACVIQGINIGQGAKLAAGTVVVKDCSELACIMGVPGKEA